MNALFRRAGIPVSLATFGLAFVFSMPLKASPPAELSWMPDQTFVQAGVAEDAQAAVVGAIWRSEWDEPFAGGDLGMYWEVSLGRWFADRADGAGSDSAWVTQVGATPVLRWTLSTSRLQWFVEGGIGANFLLPIYRTNDKRFSTTFNFGDHIAAGINLGEQGQHELALRIQHFSNAGIKHPNPGENFLQLRYAYRY
ncbi:acyloxyacyl hydrolase [Caldimonas sp. KR1-144]|uniref:acyloxyacyl hydrolase n=1 Tax=Caldimonas sp. KR1-144 TaxID=3400911 RepID=UPI003C0C0B8C